MLKILIIAFSTKIFPCCCETILISKDLDEREHHKDHYQWDVYSISEEHLKPYQTSMMRPFGKNIAVNYFG